uniref:Putative acetyltransferase n=1 Tax=Candidatus Kentrum sp. TUN TaxID=2126343 RepID=A0A451A123_9GAMM|nr:MAG: putative acetyltransferase [Candidatus Kentron sp. TUN]VFK68269.1 MAG: putative acetyltransferase [Candidatus Kentron sp. TUN]
MYRTMIIRTAQDSDLDDVLSVEHAAFGSMVEPNLVRDLLEDASAKPTLSLLAFQEGQAVGHILFTKAYFALESPLSISLLAPLAVLPQAQRQGIGTRLVEHGLQILSKSGTDLVFVLGHPEYYPRHGFRPAGVLGFDAPYPIPEKNANAWMVLLIREGITGAFGGKVICANKLKKPKYWLE